MNDCDPGPARNPLDSLFTAVKQTKKDIVRAVLEMGERHKARKELISKLSYVPLSETDPYLPIDVQRRIVAAETRARDKALREVYSQQADLIEEIKTLRTQILTESEHRIRAMLSSALQGQGTPPQTLDLEDTEERPALRSEIYEKTAEEMLYAFFIKCVNAFHEKYERRAYSARISPFNLSFLEQLLPESMHIRLIADENLSDNMMVLM